MSIQPAIGIGSVGSPSGVADAVADLRRRLSSLEAQRTVIQDGSIVNAQIIPGTITAAAIAAGTITTGLLAAGAVKAINIDAEAVTAGKIAALAVTAGTIAANAVTASTIAAGQVGATHLAAGAVTADAIVTGAVTSAKISVADLSAVSGTMGIVTGGRFQTASSGARVIMGTAIPTTAGTKNGIVGIDATDAITFFVDAATGNVQIKGQLLAGSTGLGNISGSIDGGTQINPATITGDRLVIDTITAREIAAATITATEIAANTITANKLNIGQLDAITGNLGAIVAGTITGVTYQTAASGDRLVLDNTGLSYIKAGFEAMKLSASTQGLRIATSTAAAGDANRAVTFWDSVSSAYIGYLMGGNVTGAVGDVVLGSNLTTKMVAGPNASILNWPFATDLGLVSVARGATVIKAYEAGWGQQSFTFSPTNASIGSNMTIYNNRTAADALYAYGRITADDGAGGGFFTPNGWYRTTGSRGWHNDTWGVGIHATDANWVRVFGTNRNFTAAGTTHGENFLALGSSGVIGGAGLGRLGANPADTWCQFTRSDLFGVYQDWACGGLFAGGTTVKAPVDDLAGMVDAKAEDRLESGELVCIDTDVEYEDGWDENFFRVRRATAADADRVLGVLSSKATARLMMGNSRWGRNGTMDIDANVDWRKLIAYAGIIPVKVTMENGAIRAGDRLCQGNEAGRAMRATQEGHVIGIALRDCTEDGEVIILVAPGWWAGKPQDERPAKERTYRVIPVEPKLIPTNWRDYVREDPAGNDYNRSDEERERIEAETEEARLYLEALHSEWEEQQDEARIAVGA